MSAGFLDRKDITEALHFEYGFRSESVSFLDTLNYFSPFGRLTLRRRGRASPSSSP